MDNERSGYPSNNFFKGDQMKLFVVAVPLFNADMSVEMYNLHYKNANKLFGISDDHSALDGIMNSPGLDMINEVGLEPFTGGKPIVMPVNKFMLISDFTSGCVIPHELMVFLLSRDVPMEDLFLNKCAALKTAGYRLAIYDIALNASTSQIYDLADYILVDSNSDDYLDKLKQVRTKYPYVKIIFTNVDDILMYEELKLFGSALYEGWFYKNPLTRGAATISPLKANALHLLRIMNEEDFSLEEVIKTISRDAALSIALLKFINSPAIGIKNKVTSIKNAVALLGQKETAKWVLACVSMFIAEDKPSEVTKLSLTRAKFMENLATSFEMGIHAPSLFLLGLFSLLDVILNKPMSEALKDISVSDKIKEALSDMTGEFAAVLGLIYAYERADWKEVQRIMVLNNIDAERLYMAFFESLVWYRNLLRNMDEDEPAHENGTGGR